MLPQVVRFLILTAVWHPLSLYSILYFFYYWWFANSTVMNIYYMYFDELCFCWVYDEEGISWIIDAFSFFSILSALSISSTHAISTVTSSWLLTLILISAEIQNNSCQLDTHTYTHTGLMCLNPISSSYQKRYFFLVSLVLMASHKC